jgi:hypothetical protein
MNSTCSSHKEEECGEAKRRKLSIVGVMDVMRRFS